MSKRADGNWSVSTSSTALVAGVIPGHVVSLCAGVTEYGLCQVVSVGMGPGGTITMVLAPMGTAI